MNTHQLQVEIAFWGCLVIANCGNSTFVQLSFLGLAIVALVMKTWFLK